MSTEICISPTTSLGPRITIEGTVERLQNWNLSVPFVAIQAGLVEDDAKLTLFSFYTGMRSESA